MLGGPPCVHISYHWTTNIKVFDATFLKSTRMHSSRMRTARSLTISRRIPRTPPRHYARPSHNHAHPPNPHNHTCPRNHACRPPQPCTPPSNDALPPVKRMTDRQVQKHNLRKLRLRAVININIIVAWDRVSWRFWMPWWSGILHRSLAHCGH